MLLEILQCAHPMTHVHVYKKIVSTDLNGYSVTRVLDHGISCLKTQFVFNRNVKRSPRSGFILVFRNILARVPSLAFQTSPF